MNDVQHNQVIWRSRRGLLELDLLLYPFAQNRYQSLSNIEQNRYAELLSCEDPDLLKWLKDSESCPPEFKIIVDCIVRHSELKA